MLESANRNQIIIKLKNAAPALTSVSFSEDMGYEFSAIVHDGVIYAEPGMLVSYSDGYWPPDAWEGFTSLEQKQRLNAFLLEKAWPVKAWGKLSLVELEQWLDNLDEL